MQQDKTMSAIAAVVHPTIIALDCAAAGCCARISLDVDVPEDATVLDEEDLAIEAS